MSILSNLITNQSGIFCLLRKKDNFSHLCSAAQARRALVALLSIHHYFSGVPKTRKPTETDGNWRKPAETEFIVSLMPPTALYWPFYIQKSWFLDS